MQSSGSVPLRGTSLPMGKLVQFDNVKDTLSRMTTDLTKHARTAEMQDRT